MGCDIHFVIERKLGDRWVGVYSTESTPRLPTIGGRMVDDLYDRYPPFKERNYAFFARLAGVRGDGPDPLGLPEDVSDLAHLEFANDGDMHSHSYLPYEEFLRRWDLSQGDETVAQMVAAEITDIAAAQRRRELLSGRYADETLEDFRVVFCFDN